MNGIDVSYFQETINWDLVKPNIDFAMIRAGYGKTTLTSRPAEMYLNVSA